MTRHHRRRRARRAPVLVLGLLAASLVLLVAGVVLTGTSSTSEAAPTAQADAAAPAAIDIPAIGARSSLVSTGLDRDRAIAVPSVHTPEQAAWYSGSPAPGTPGPAVVVGHVNGDGRDGVFADLADTGPGDVVRVTRADHSVAVFTVSRVDTVAKNAFPTRAVYGDTPGPELRLITCGGVFDRTAHSYESNVIVYAALAAIERVP